MDEEYIVRQYQPNDEKGIVKLLTTVFDPWPNFDLTNSKQDYWHWLYQKNPLNSLNSHAVAVSKNREIIGCNHGTTLTLRIKGQQLLSQIAGGLAVHEDHRRKGVSTKIRTSKREIHDRNKIDMTYQFTTNPIVIESSIKRGRPTFPTQILRMFKIFDINLHIEKNKKNAWWKRYGYKTLYEIEQLLSTYQTKKYQTEEKVQIKEIKEFDPRITVFWEKIKDHYDFIVERTRDYLNWRYCDENGGSYFVIQAEEGDNVLGYSVLRVNRLRKDYANGFIVDLLSLPGRDDVIRELINYAIDFFIRDSVNIIHAWTLEDHLIEKIYLENGFFKRKEQFYVSLNTMSELSISQVKAIKNVSADRLHLQYGDSDTI